MSKPKPRSASGHVIAQPQPVCLDWRALERAYGATLPDQVKSQVHEALAAYQTWKHLDLGTQARSRLGRIRHKKKKPPATAEDLYRSLAEAQRVWRALQADSAAQALFSDLDAELRVVFSADPSGRDRGLSALMQNLAQVLPFTRLLFDADFAATFAKEWDRRLSDSQSLTAKDREKVGLPDRIAGMLAPAPKRAATDAERRLVYGLANIFKAAKLPVTGSSASETSSGPSAFQNLVAELNSQLPAHLRLPNQSRSRDALAGWISKRLTEWRRLWPDGSEDKAQNPAL